MVIAKEKILHLLHYMPDEIDVDEVVDQIKLTAKIDQALEESNRGLGQDWEEFKKEWLNEDL
ncbi:hypothetical protein [Mucilaginibacter arboris]|uniref:Addiction module component n=1 Tax=Mucilaginibacter arboris TaxID=2682090 RepID=A0A7K1SVE1_9SPHI|nr:hypothetical protein [Mucilaginibacter arboris]MVN21253.1 hypothetical protein [Mucilaginibacter arboris]